MGKLLKKIWFEIKMHSLDSKWYMQGFHCWELYPPSFYYRHTPEEQKQIIEREIGVLRKMLEEYKEEHGASA